MSERKIGVLAESSLHASLKAIYASPLDRVEVDVAGFVVDIVKNDGVLVEIQTGNFASIRRKLTHLLNSHTIILVLPVAAERWITRINRDGEVLSHRKSPKRGGIIDLFKELTAIPRLATHPNFVLEVVLMHEEQVWRDDGLGSWRRKHWSISDRALSGIVGKRQFSNTMTFLDLLPAGLSMPFTSSELAHNLKAETGLKGPKPSAALRSLAGKMSYCLHEMNLLERVGKKGRSYLYTVKPSAGRG